VKNPTMFDNYETQDPFFGGQQVTKLLTELETQIPVVNYGSKTYEIEDILEAEFQNVLVDDDLQTCLRRVQEKAEAVARE
jgi:lactose-binding protein (LBP)